MKWQLDNVPEDVSLARQMSINLKVIEDKARLLSQAIARGDDTAQSRSWELQRYTRVVRTTLETIE